MRQQPNHFFVHVRVLSPTLLCRCCDVVLNLRLAPSSTNSKLETVNNKKGDIFFFRFSHTKLISCKGDCTDQYCLVQQFTAHTWLTKATPDVAFVTTPLWTLHLMRRELLGKEKTTKTTKTRTHIKAMPRAIASMVTDQKSGLVDPPTWKKTTINIMMSMSAVQLIV